MKKTISNYHIRMKLEGLMHEMQELLDIAQELESREALKGQSKLQAAAQETPQMPLLLSNTWRDYCMKKWPTYEEFEYDYSKDPHKIRGLYEMVTMKKKILPFIKDETKAIYAPNVEVLP